MESSFNTSENIIIKDKETLAYKLKQFISDGVSSLQVITDFDQTLTKYMVDGCRGSSTFAVLHESNFVSKELIRKSQENYEYYSKIEQDQTISTEDKCKHMDEWWGQALTNIVQESISKNDFENMTRDSNLCFRNGIGELIELKKKLKFPFVIVSAGIGEIIKSAFHLLAEEQKIDDEFINSIDILSNLGIYDEGDTIIGFESPIQTVMNKNENIYKYYQANKSKLKSNIILLGDLSEDANMVEFVPCKNCIKIGFFNLPISSPCFDSFCSKYDIVITNDGNLDILNSIIKLTAGVDESLDQANLMF